MVCSNNVSILHRFRDIVFVYACELEKFSAYGKAREISSQVRRPVEM